PHERGRDALGLDRASGGYNRYCARLACRRRTDRAIGERSAAGDDILGVVVAVSDEDARKHPQPVALLFDMQPEGAGPTALAELSLPLSEDIRTAMLKWEIARFSACGIGLDLAPGWLFLVEGWFDADDRENAASSLESADVQVAPALHPDGDDPDR